jgi:hypothetical protein
MRQRLQRHLLAQLVCLGDHTITGLLSTSGRQQQDWSADYRMYSRQRVCPQALFDQVRSGLLDSLPPTEPVVVAIDDTQVHKCGQKVFGAKYTRDPMGPKFQVNLIWAQRFFQISMAAGDAEHVRMIPIGFQQAPAPPKPRKDASEEEKKLYRQASKKQSLGAVATAQLRQTRDWLDAHAAQQRSLWTTADGGYTNGPVLKKLPENTVFVGRLRSDAKLYHLPAPPAGGRGRRRVYGERAPTPEQLRQDEAVAWQTIEVWIHGVQRQLRVKSLGPLRWRAAGGQRNLKLVVIAPINYRVCPSGKHLYRKPVYLICTDPDAEVATIVQRYIYRWDIEVNFRDEKTLLGAGEAQVRNQNSVQAVPATAVAAYALLLVAATRIIPSGYSPCDLPRPKWQRREPHRATTQRLLQQTRFELWGQAMNFSGFASPSSSTQVVRNSLSNPAPAVFYASRYS